MLLMVYFPLLLLQFESHSTRYRYLLAFCSSDFIVNLIWVMSSQVYGSMNVFFFQYSDQDRKKQFASP